VKRMGRDSPGGVVVPHDPGYGLYGLYIPYSNLAHLMLVPANQYFSDLSPKGTIKPINFENETQESFGVANIEEFT